MKTAVQVPVACLKAISLLLATAMATLAPLRLMWGQISDRAVITGLVTDVSGAAVPGAKLTFVDEATGTKTATGTNTAGNYSSPDLILSTYTVQVEKEGFKTFVRRGLTLTSRPIPNQRCSELTQCTSAGADL